MPLPTPTPNESQSEFTSRCMADENMVNDFEDSAQRYAVCISQYENAKLKEALAEFTKSQVSDLQNFKKS